MNRIRRHAKNLFILKLYLYIFSISSLMYIIYKKNIIVNDESNIYVVNKKNIFL